jgi:hypothetical protein
MDGWWVYDVGHRVCFFVERGAVWRLLFDGVSASCIDWRHVLVMECVRDDVSRLDVPGMKRGSDGL